MATDMMMQDAMAQAADAGRSTDTILAHLTLGEVVIPREIVEDPEVAQVLQAIYQAYGVDMREFTVGDPSNKINPETGHPEFFFKKIKSFIKKIAPIALPILGSMIPGVGTALGAALGGAAGGLVSGGGIKGALLGAGTGYLGGSVGSGLLGQAASIPTGLTQGPAFAGSGIKGALTGGGLKALGNTSISSFIKPAASLYSNMQEDDAAEEAKRAMLEGNARSEAAFDPYNQAQMGATNRLAEGFDPGDLASDPGYQFRLNQGIDAQNKGLAAAGLGQSGAALKAAQEYGQQFASQEYGNAYDRWMKQNKGVSDVASQGANTANALSGVYSNTGNVQAASAQEEAERKNKRIADILAGLGYGSKSSGGGFNINDYGGIWG